MSNIDFSPKKQFQTNERIVKELLTVVQSDNFHTALSAAFSEWAYRRTPSADQLVAVRDFINTLITLPSPSQPLPHFPVKTLDHTVYDPVRSETTTQTIAPRRHD